MRTKSKPLHHLGVEDFHAYPIWEFFSDACDRLVRPVKRLPVASLSGRIVGTEVLLNNRTSKWVVLSNMDLDCAKQTQHFLTVWIEQNAKWFELARYFDLDFDRRGPQQLADFLGLSVSQVFPILYDISSIAIGDKTVTKGRISAEPIERLTRAELIRLSISA